MVERRRCKSDLPRYTKVPLADVLSPLTKNLTIFRNRSHPINNKFFNSLDLITVLPYLVNHIGTMEVNSRTPSFVYFQF